MKLLTDSEQQMLDSRGDLRLVSAANAFGKEGSEAAAFPLVQISNSLCQGLVALQGAQVLSFQPLAHSDLLWLSPNASFVAGEPVRGGIPVCLPWFGINQRQPTYPKHGFARTSRWQLKSVTGSAGAATRLLLVLRDFVETPHPLFAYPFEAQLSLSFGQQLDLSLTVTNTGVHAFPLSWALHSYHPIGDLNALTVSGLVNGVYLDNTRNLQRAVQRDAPVFGEEFDRVYLGVGRQQVIHGSPSISVSARGAPSAIVWNPGARLSEAIGDLGVDTYRQFVCLERGAAFDDEQIIMPAQVFQATVTIGTSPTAG